jgi:hypothetical protein
VLSADADFTPVLRKLRRYDRRTSVLAIGFPSAAYQASADLLIDERLFIEQALGLAPEPADVDPEARPVATPGLHDRPSTPVIGAGHAQATPEQLADIARRIEAAVAQSALPVPAGPLASRLRQAYAPLLDQWNGHGMFKPFFRSLGLDRLVWLSGSGGRIADPSRHATEGATVADNLADAAQETSPIAAEGTGGSHSTALVAAAVDDTDGDTVPAATDDPWSGHEALLPVAREVCQLTGAPLLAPPTVRAVLDALCADLAVQGYEPTETARRVRTACGARTPAVEVSLRDVVFILRGMQLNGHVFGRGQDDARTLAQRLCNQVMFLCQREQMVTDDGTRSQIRQWIAGDLLA